MKKLWIYRFTILEALSGRFTFYMSNATLRITTVIISVFMVNNIYIEYCLRIKCNNLACAVIQFYILLTVKFGMK